MTTATEIKKRTITMSGRTPVTILEDLWPMLAAGNFSAHDGQVECQAKQTWNCCIRVREHSDGRCLVYGTYLATCDWQGARSQGAKAGYLCALADVVAHINLVASDMVGILGEYSEHIMETARECIANMPAEEI